MTTQQEMSLFQWVEELPIAHRARQEYQDLMTALADNRDALRYIAILIRQKLKDQGVPCADPPIPPPPQIDPDLTEEIRLTGDLVLYEGEHGDDSIKIGDEFLDTLILKMLRPETARKDPNGPVHIFEFGDCEIVIRKRETVEDIEREKPFENIPQIP